MFVLRTHKVFCYHASKIYTCTGLFQYTKSRFILTRTLKAFNLTRTLHQKTKKYPICAQIYVYLSMKFYKKMTYRYEMVFLILKHLLQVVYLKRACMSTTFHMKIKYMYHTIHFKSFARVYLDSKLKSKVIEPMAVLADL